MQDWFLFVPYTVIQIVIFGVFFCCGACLLRLAGLSLPEGGRWSNGSLCFFISLAFLAGFAAASFFLSVAGLAGLLNIWALWLFAVISTG